MRGADGATTSQEPPSATVHGTNQWIALLWAGPAGRYRYFLTAPRSAVAPVL